MNHYIKWILVILGVVFVCSPLLIVAAYVVGEVLTFQQVGTAVRSEHATTNPVSLVLFLFSMAVLFFPLGMFLLCYLVRSGQWKLGKFWVALVALAAILCVCFPVGTVIGVASIAYLRRNKVLFMHGYPLPPPLFPKAGR